MENLFRISRLAETTGVTPRTIRFYVQEGLITKPVRVRKNMFLYHPECIDQIRAIKNAQSRRFLPLVVVRRLLKQHNYDYSVLETASVLGSSPAASGLGRHGNAVLESLPELMLRVFETKGWLNRGNGKHKSLTYGRINEPLVRFLGMLNDNGAPWEDLVSRLGDIEALIRKTAELEYQSFGDWSLKAKGGDFLAVQELGFTAMEAFGLAVRRHHRNTLARQQKQTLDYGFKASTDEGYSLLPEEILPQLKAMAERTGTGPERIRLYKDLALGYSCIGDVETALDFLGKALALAPDDLEAQVRWLWYSRFSEGRTGDIKIKVRMEALVGAHPDFGIGRLFLGVWHVLDSLETDTPTQGRRLLQRAFRELAAAEKYKPRHLHWQTLIRYSRARVLMTIPDGSDLLEQSLESFRKILVRKRDIDLFYRTRLPFFSKWLWPNVYYFYGMALARSGRFNQASKILKRGTAYSMAPPFMDHMTAGIRTVNMAMGR